jgi:manganese-dependent inorganic pyrophosphatase
MENKVYVIGHRNPDADSVVSAAAYAAFKQSCGMSNVFAARAGNLNPQTEYIFERFKALVPEYLPDLTPKAAYFMKDNPATINEHLPLWNALEKMKTDNLRVLPIVDDLGVYKGMLHYSGFASYITTHINPHEKAIFPISIEHLTETLRAQPLCLFDAQEVKDSSIVIAASYNAYFVDHLPHPKHSLVIMGDRFDLQRFCIKQQVRALVLSGGHTLPKELEDLARQNHVSVLSSPYDTASTAMLIMYSISVGDMGDTEVPLIKLGESVRSLRGLLSQAPSRCLPIGDDEGRVAGLLFEGDLINEPAISLIMVDHNEPSQAIEGIENYHILEVIDHHRLGNLSTRYPITFINKPVGATSTIITGIYRMQHVPMRREIASILLCGILSDTLGLKSATTTDEDRETARYLATVTGLDVASLSQELSAASSRIADLDAKSLIRADMKEYNEAGVCFTVSQIETSNPESVAARRDELLSALDTSRQTGNALFAALMVTDVTTLDSLLFVAGNERFISSLNFPHREDGIFVMKGMVSRKKQLIPLLSELIEKAH